MILFEGVTPDSKTLHYVLKTGTKGDIIIQNPRTKKREAIRYASNQPSVYISQQVGDCITPAIVMEEGYLKVPKTNSILLDFLRLSPQYNRDFREVDPERDAQEKIERKEMVLDIQSAFRTKQKEVYGDVSLASLLIMKSNRSFTPEQIDAMGPSQVREILYTLSENDPEIFLNSKGKVDCFENNDFIRHDLVIRSLSEGLINVSTTGREIFWGNGELLLDVPSGKRYRDYLADFFLSTEGEKVMQDLATNLKKQAKKK